MLRILNLSLLILVLASAIFAQTYGDRVLSQVLAKDARSKTSNGQLLKLPVGEHMYRADVYMSNRKFPQARMHWQNVLKHYAESGSVPKALFGMGRSNMWERNYQTAVTWFDRLATSYPGNDWGKEGLAYKGASYVRLGNQEEAIRAYEKYTVMYPYGKRIESSHLNIIDAYREAGRYELANKWVDRTVKRFGSLPTAINALHAQFRMEIFRKNWNNVISVANELLRRNTFKGTMAFEYEIRYLKGFAFEKLNNPTAARYEYAKIPASPFSYYAGLATDRLDALGADTKARHATLRTRSRAAARNYPIRYRSLLLKHSKTRGIDPRFVLAVMKQESSFRPRAKSPSAARGLLQLVFDTALKYKDEAGYPNLKGTDLYSPEVNIKLGSIYIAELKNEFGGLYEAIAASYNGGEDNVRRWLGRTQPKDKAIFTTEVGFSESKKYVYKVLANYRVYQELYTENLTRR